MRLPRGEQAWFLLLFVGSGVARVALLTLHFRRVAPALGVYHWNARCTARATPEQQLRARSIGRLTGMASRYTPWASTCLVQALVARWALAYYRIPYVLHLGVAKAAAGDNALQAHAWLRVGPWVITGREGHEAYTIVATFVAPAVLRR